MDLVRVELGMCLEASGSRDAVGVELQAQNSRRRSFGRIDLDFIEIDRADAHRQKHHGAHSGEALITFGFIAAQESKPNATSAKWLAIERHPGAFRFTTASRI